MKIKLLDLSLNFWQTIASWIPFKSKRYVKKWLKIRDAWINVVHLSYSDGNLKAYLVLNPECMINQVYNNHFANASGISVVRGISMRDLWDNLLTIIAHIENMRNVDELKIWLDMQIV